MIGVLRKVAPCLAAALVAAASLSAVADAKPKPKKSDAAAATAAAGEKDKPYQEWKKVTKDAEVMKGFFTLYKKRENLYLELAPDQLGKPVLGIFSFARGIGANFVLGGLPLNDRIMTFERSGDRVLVMEQNMIFTAPKGSAIEKAKNLSFGNSVIAALKIESVHDSSKALLVDLAPFLVSDLTDVGEWVRQSYKNKPFRFDKDRSALGTVKVFPENTEIQALLTYAPSDRLGLNFDSVSDNRYLPITVHYSFSKLPEQPMQPRLADDRVGFFLTAMKDFSRDTQEHFWVRYLKRWRLEKKDPTATLSEPVKPIVFYIDHTVPAEYRPWVKEGVELWQRAFEAAGFKNAIVAKDAPADSTWDAEDVRYSTIRWITSSTPSFGAIGPSRMDPRTGEILDADILFEQSMMQNYRNTYRRYGGPDAMAAEVLPWLHAESATGLPLSLRCEAAAGHADEAGLMRTSMLLDGSLPPGSPVPDAYMREAVVEVTMHEVGHTLGLRHNFRSSTSTPGDKLYDRAWLDDKGVTGSVMDYSPVNVSSDRSKQAQYFSTTVGTYDVWAIRFGYTPSGATDVTADYAFAEKIADESNRPGHEYSTDEDTYPADALDPRTNIWDLSEDPLAFAKDRTAYIAGLMKSPQFEQRILGENGSYPVLRRAVDNLLLQYGRALGLAVKYVGGQYQVRDHKGQPDARPALTPVPAARQKEAVDFLGQRAFAANAFEVTPVLLNRLTHEQWLHWGIPNGFSEDSYRIDFNLSDKIFVIQNTLLSGLMSPSLLARLREAEGRSTDAYRLSDHFDRMTRMLWGEVGGGSAAAMKAVEGPNNRRLVQRAYVDRLAALVVAPSDAPDDARALARLQLSRIDARAARVLASGGSLGDYTRAHLLETRARVSRALEAGLEAKDTPARGANAVATPIVEGE